MYQVKKTGLEGCLELIPKVFSDQRGTSVKTFHMDTFKELGLEVRFDEDLIVMSQKNVLRGFHFQNLPFGQTKLIYCLNGKILDVVLDIRVGSPTYGKYEMFTLSSSNNHLLYVPEGFAHGYLALEDQSIVMYKMSSVYNPEFEGGIRWDSVDMDWGIENPIISERDKQFISFNQFQSKFLW